MWELIRMLRDIVPMVKGMQVELKEIHEELTAIRILLEEQQVTYTPYPTYNGTITYSSDYEGSSTNEC